MSTWTVVLVLVVVTARYAGCYIEPVEERGCQDTSLRLTCRHLQAHIAILNATFSTDATLLAAVDNSSCDRGAYASRGRPVVPLEDYDIREALNYRCSGKNHCSFILAEDHEPAATWGPGVVVIKYACFNGEHKTKFCNEEINVAEEGFVMSPGYPIYYVNKDDCYWLLKASPGQRVQVTLLDMSLRSVLFGTLKIHPTPYPPFLIKLVKGFKVGTGPRESNCTDHLQVIEDGRVMMDECGELAKAIVIMSEGNMLNLTFTGLSQNMFPKRGVLFHYKAIGCVQLNPPKDGYMVFRNQTDAQFMCCVDYMFPDTLDRLRDLHCHNGNTWNNSLPDCITDKSLKPWGWIGTPMPTNSLKDINITNSHTAAIVKESDFVFDVMLPTLIICVLLIGNGVIIVVIFYMRKRKIPQNGDQEELDGIIQPQDGSVCDKPINV